jgi:hypothetical protein
LYFAIGEKEQQESGQGYLSIRVFVSDKILSLPKSKRLPKRIRGVNPDGSAADYWIPLDVESIPEKFQALSVQGGDKIRRILTGSVGLVYVSRSRRNFLITNSHIIARPNERAFKSQVRKIGVEKPIGEVHRMSILKPGIPNKMDAAIVWLYEDVHAEFLTLRNESHLVSKVGRLLSITSTEYFFVNHQGVKKRFKKPNELHGQIPVEINGQDIFFQGVWILKLVGRISAVHGDSGSLLVRQTQTGLTAVGLVFAGTDNLVAVFPLSKVFSTLGRVRASANSETEDVRIDFS